MNQMLKAAPTSLCDRLVHLDFIRGVAVLGILVMNIQSFSMPAAAYSNPTVYGDLTGINYAVWFFSHLFFDQKFMTMFSLLFGVSLMLFSERVEHREGQSGARYYLRTGWLLLFGLMHAYFFWWGDVLTVYAICGMFSYLFRHSSVKGLVSAALTLFGIVSLLLVMQSLFADVMSEADVARDILPYWDPGAEHITRELSAHRGSWQDAFLFRINMASDTLAFMVGYLPRVLGLQLLGMALYKSGFALGQWQKSVYIKAALMCIPFGIWLTYIGVLANEANDYDWRYSTGFGAQYNYWGSLITAFGYFSLLLAGKHYIENNRWTCFLTNVGRTAFTNYILQSFICTFLIYGYGLNLYGSLQRYQQLLMVILVWGILLAFSNLWLRYFKQGPLEWLWRWLTYRAQGKTAYE